MEAENRVSLDIFEGPLDLLLYLIKRDEVDIYEVSIERITSQYLEYIDTFKILNIELASEFVVMAANLMYIKSRTLLPRHEQPPGEDIDCTILSLYMHGKFVYRTGFYLKQVK